MTSFNITIITTNRSTILYPAGAGENGNQLRSARASYWPQSERAIGPSSST